MARYRWDHRLRKRGEQAQLGRKERLGPLACLEMCPGAAVAIEARLRASQRAGGRGGRKHIHRGYPGSRSTPDTVRTCVGLA